MKYIHTISRTAKALAGSAAILFSGIEAAQADAYSPVVGLLKFSCPGGSDTVVSAPFHPAPRWTGKLSADPTDPGSGAMRLTIDGTPDFAPGELTDAPHFLFCRNGSAAEGRHFPIIAHTGSAVDVEASPADLAGLTTGGLIAILPAWTLDTLFPAATQTALHASTGNLATQRGSELLLFDRVTAGTRLAPSRRFFVNSAGWFEAGTYAPAGGESIAPGQPFVIRHPAGAAATTFSATQQVYGDKVALPIRTRQAGPQDNALGLPRPVALPLSDLDLDGVIADSASTTAQDRKDELRVYDNALVGSNKGPLAVYFKVAGQWIKDTDGFPAAANDLIDPAAGLLLRKAATDTDGRVLWVNVPRYDVTAP